MATGGWEDYGGLGLPTTTPKRRRGTVIQRVAAQAETTRERDLQRATERILDELQARGRILCWYHRPDRATRA